MSLLKRQSLLKRLMAKVVQTDDGCWNFTGSLNKGYGRIGAGGRGNVTTAHRASYELFVGPIPPGLVLDHLCNNRSCCNPDHLRATTNRENILRGDGACAKHARQTHCKRGHEFTADNTYITPNGGRECKTCRTARINAWKLRKGIS